MAESERVRCPVPQCEGFVYAPIPGLVACDGPEHHGDATIRDHAISSLDDDGTEADAIERRLDPHNWRHGAIDRATHGDSTPSEDAPRPPESMLGAPPSWPSKLGGMDDLRGLTVFSGKSSSGKTAAALPSALAAASAGWNVMYLAAEGPAVVQSRVDVWCQSRGVKCPARFDLRYAPADMTLERFQLAVKRFATTARTLVVLDSVNSLVDSFVSDDDVHGIGPLKRLAMWMMRVRQYTQGEVSFLVLSEANAQGEAKGRAFDHKADMSVNFEKSGEDWTVKKVFVVKNWWGVPGPVGDFEYDADRACLTTHAEAAARSNAAEADERGDDDPFDAPGGLYQ